MFNVFPGFIQLAYCDRNRLCYPLLSAIHNQNENNFVNMHL